MQLRIKQHQQQRPADWHTFEEPYHPLAVLKKHQHEYQTWLLECLTLYISNLFFAETADKEIGETFDASAIQASILQEIDRLTEFIQAAPLDLIIVTNEVGWGIVPGDPLSRAYSDIIGKVNQKLAQAAEEVYLVALGIPLQLKPQSR